MGEGGLVLGLVMPTVYTGYLGVHGVVVMGGRASLSGAGGVGPILLRPTRLVYDTWIIGTTRAILGR